MDYSSDEEATTPMSISLEIKPPNHTASTKRRTSRRQKEEGLKCSRVQETLKDERIVYKKNVSSDRDRQRGFHDVVDHVKTRKPSKSKKLKIKILDDMGHSKTWLIPHNSTPIVNDETTYLSGSIIDGRRSRLALQVPVDVEEYDDDMLEAAEALLMLRNGPSMAESKGNKKCLGFDLNKPPPPSP